MSVFNRALIIATIADADGPQSVEDLWILADGDHTQRQVGRDLERLESEGVLVRTEHSTYCSTCGSDGGVEHRYAINPAWSAKAEATS